MVVDLHHHECNSFPLFGGSTQAAPAAPTTAPLPQSSGPQNNSWMFKNQTAPSFTPPAPAEAAASWANHASLANAKAQSALRDIMQIRVDAANRVNSLHAQAQQTMDRIEGMRASTFQNMQKDSTVVYNNYLSAKTAVIKMLHEAQRQALAAKQLATNTSDAVREHKLAQKISVQTSSFAHKSTHEAQKSTDETNSSESQTPNKEIEGASSGSSAAVAGSDKKIGESGPGLNDDAPGKETASGEAPAGPSEGAKNNHGESSSAQRTDRSMQRSRVLTILADKSSSSEKKLTQPPKTEQDKDIENVLKLIRQYNGKTQQGATKTVMGNQTKDELADISKQASQESEKQSSEQLKQNWADKDAKAQQQIRRSSKDADVKAFMARLSEGTLLYDTAAAVSAALKSAKDMGDSLLTKELDAEKQILGLLRNAQQSTIDAANEASKAEMIAFKAANFTQQMADQARYAQNAAGQAMAAQMAQALGFKVVPQPVASPFMSLPRLTKAAMDVAALVFPTNQVSDRKAYLSTLI